MQDEPQVVKTATSPSLSGQSAITYEVGVTPDSTIHIRLAGNSGNGIFNGYWVSMPEILQLLNDQEGPFTWSTLQPLFKGRSVNSACFLMAALKDEGLVKHSEKEPRRYVAVDPKAFMAKVQAAIAPNPTKPKKGAKPPPNADPPAEPVTHPAEPTVEA